MHIGQYRHFELVAYLGKDPQSFFDTQPTVAIDRRAVRLVEGRFENKRHRQPLADFLHAAGGFEIELQALYDARPGDQKQRLVYARLEIAKFHACTASGICSRWKPRAALTKPANSGCPSRGVEVNSGWN
ncbi:hypothetical protein MnTg04_00434 [bacterium MnTg04]|nr:hypothetical protein MnTg04_00434 [bacterium MnTg04]